MSVTGPGCAACDYTGRVTFDGGDAKPCDACGGWSQFAAPVPTMTAEEEAAIDRLIREHVPPPGKRRLVDATDLTDLRARVARILPAIEADRVRWQDHAPSCIHDATGRGRCADCNEHESCAAAVRGILGAAPSPEDDWRPLPSCAEVLAHNARTGGDCFGPWLCVEDPADEYATARVVSLAVAHGDAASEDFVCAEAGLDAVIANPAARWRPITRRGGALPWPEALR